MTTADFLPLGRHRLDPPVTRDPIRVLLSGLQTDVHWTVERAMSVDIHRRDNEPGDEAREFSYLPGDTDDSLQTLARLIELLLLGHKIDWLKIGPHGRAPRYFQPDAFDSRAEFKALGTHALDPVGHTDPVRALLQSGKDELVRLNEDVSAYRGARLTNLAVADAVAQRMSATSQRASALLDRARELLLLGHQIDLANKDAIARPLRVFKNCTTADWLAATHPAELCYLLRPLDYGVMVYFQPRKWQRFALACVRRVQHTFTDPRTVALVDAAEQHADGELATAEADEIWKRRNEPPNADAGRTESSDSPVLQAAHEAFQALAHATRCNHAGEAMHAAACARGAITDPAEEARAQAALVREIFGNPFTVRPAEPEWLEWRGGTVVALACGIDAERAFDRMPVLADALEDAGCSDAEILAHCREPHAHVRGCWVIDLLLGRHLLAPNEEGSPDGNESF